MELVRKLGVKQPVVCAAVRNLQKIIEENQFKLSEKVDLRYASPVIFKLLKRVLTWQRFPFLIHYC